MGECDSCHQPHASKYPKLLDVVGTDLCLACHTDFKKQLASVKFTHKALDEGCDHCHDAHGSEYPKGIAVKVGDLCLSCHEKIKAQTAQAAYQHPAVMEDRACMTCHTAHGRRPGEVAGGPACEDLHELPQGPDQDAQGRRDRGGVGGERPGHVQTRPDSRRTVRWVSQHTRRRPAAAAAKGQFTEVLRAILGRQLRPVLRLPRRSTGAGRTGRRAHGLPQRRPQPALRPREQDGPRPKLQRVSCDARGQVRAGHPGIGEVRQMGTAGYVREDGHGRLMQDRLPSALQL